MSKQRGPVLLPIIYTVLAVSGGHASTIQEPAIEHASASCGAADCRWNVHCDNWLGYWVPKAIWRMR
jgi:hypothetical protein